MFIAIDGVDSATPDDVVSAFNAFEQSATEVDMGTTQAKGEDARFVGMSIAHDRRLDRWDVQAHQYSTEGEANGTILGSLFSAKGKIATIGVIQEAKRYRRNLSTAGRRVEFGVAVRLAVATDSKSANINLSLANLAAGAQLSNFEARVALSVVGFVGPLGNLLPAPGEFNVENLHVYTEAFKEIQAHVFGDENLKFLAPTMLGFYDDETDLGATDRSHQAGG